MLIKVLGSGCANCVRLEENVKRALAEKGIDAEVVKITDYSVIAAYGVLRTPGLVVDETLVSSGKVATVDELINLLSTTNN